MEIPINPYLNFLVIFLSGGIGAWVGSYLGQKGKNSATKEDIEAITQKIESVKAELGSRLYVHQFRYQKEFEILQELAEVSTELREAAQQLYPVGPSFETLGESPEEKKRRRLKQFWEAMKNFIRITEIRRPFFPEEIYQLLRALVNQSQMRVLDYQDLRSHERPQIEVFKEDAEEIDKISKNILEAIRQRVKKWESLFPE